MMAPVTRDRVRCWVGDRPERADGRRAVAAVGARSSRPGPGARSARTTPRTARPGRPSRTTRPARATYRWNEDGLAAVCDRDQRLCLGPGPVERRRPDPEGAAVRPDRAGGQPRRGRQGVLLAPRRDADALVAALALPLPAARLPVRRAGGARTRRGPGRAGVRAARHRTPSTDDRFWVVDVTYAKAGPGRPLPADRGDQRRAGPGDPACVAAPVVSQHLGVGAAAQRWRGGVPPSIGVGAPGALVARHASLGSYTLAYDAAAGAGATLVL